jgi:hypothetical protein
MILAKKQRVGFYGGPYCVVSFYAEQADCHAVFFKVMVFPIFSRKFLKKAGNASFWRKIAALINFAAIILRKYSNPAFFRSLRLNLR